MKDAESFMHDAARAANALADTIDQDIFSRLCDVASECESPIEQKLMMALVRSGWDWCNRIDISTPSKWLMIGYRDSQMSIAEYEAPKDRGDIAKKRKHDGVLIELQRKIGSYRVDFFASIFCQTPTGSYEPVGLIVECDGHDFHEKTKDQAKRDKSRDRELKLLGHDVFRFTGSEIWNDAAKCASQVFEYLETAVLTLDGKHCDEVYGKK